MFGCQMQFPISSIPNAIITWLRLKTSIVTGKCCTKPFAPTDTNLCEKQNTSPNSPVNWIDYVTSQMHTRTVEGALCAPKRNGRIPQTHLALRTSNTCKRMFMRANLNKTVVQLQSRCFKGKEKCCVCCHNVNLAAPRVHIYALITEVLEKCTSSSWS